MPPLSEESTEVVASAPALAWMDRFGRRGWVAFPIAIAAVLLIACVDWLTRDDVLFVVLYLLPVGVLTWGRSVHAGMAMGILAVSTLLFLDRWHVLGGHGGISDWNKVMLLVTTCLVAGIVRGLKASHLRVLSLLDTERRLAREDPLTGVATARAFYERFSLEIERMKRTGNPLSLLYLDLDDFKRVNDERGHLVGDEVLSRIGRVLRTLVRRVDLCARLGGDEFLVLMPETGREEAANVAQRVREGVLGLWGEGGPAVGISGGLGTFEKVPLDAEATIGLVDRLMYEAKRGGKNRIVERVFH